MNMLHFALAYILLGLAVPVQFGWLLLLTVAVTVIQTNGGLQYKGSVK